MAILKVSVKNKEYMYAFGIFERKFRKEEI